jgi:hypothetical protein
MKDKPGQLPYFPTQHLMVRGNPLLQGCYDALRDLKAMCDNPSTDYYQHGMIDADEVWAALEPLRNLVFEVDGTNTSARLDARTPEEMLAAYLNHRNQLFVAPKESEVI